MKGSDQPRAWKTESDRAPAPPGKRKGRIFSWVILWADFVKLAHTVFALPFALASMIVAARADSGWPGWRIFALVMGAMITARNSAMAFNRIVDRDYDRLNPRTHDRHLPRGAIAPWEAWVFFAVNAGLFLGISRLLNPLCFYLSPVALAVVCFYSLTKRFTDFTHIYLGVALALAPIGSWLAVKGEVRFWPMGESFLLPLLLGLAVVFWLIGFDIIYAVQDYEFDRSHNLHSLVVRWGVKNALQAAFLSHLVMWGCLALYGLLCRFRVAYLIGLIIILASLLLEHWLAPRRSLKWIQTSFFRLNALVSIVFLLVTFIEVAFRGFRFNS